MTSTAIYIQSSTGTIHTFAECSSIRRSRGGQARPTKVTDAAEIARLTGLRSAKLCKACH